MPIVAHTCPFVVGVDTHARTHTLVILTGKGEHVDQAQFPSSPAGLRRAVDWTGRRTGDAPDTLWAVEGISSYGAALARLAAEAGRLVLEAPRADPRRRHGIGKSDPLDARAIATAVLPLDTAKLARPREDHGTRAALRVLVAARDDMTRERTSHVNALTALLRTADLGADARKSLTAALIAQIAGWRTRDEPLAVKTARAEAVRLAKRVTDLGQQLKTNKADMTRLIRESPAGPLLDKTGIGPVTAAIALAAWPHPGRIRPEAAFAALAGVNPIPASSGNTIRRRLNRGGDRQPNWALHMAVITRMAYDSDTIAYVQRRTAEGRTTREIRRRLKRYLCRHIYRTLNTLHNTPTAA
ncbi:MAG: IS110 family transposase [Propionibacteriaceae bacterium]|jgi:hypothetical protein|nr:IS110 family transposase [Propionibacteriaceae bacterium]